MTNKELQEKLAEYTDEADVAVGEEGGLVLYQNGAEIAHIDVPFEDELLVEDDDE